MFLLVPRMRQGWPLCLRACAPGLARSRLPVFLPAALWPKKLLPSFLVFAFLCEEGCVPPKGFSWEEMRAHPASPSPFIRCSPGHELACVPSFLSPICFGTRRSCQLTSHSDGGADPVKDPAPLGFSGMSFWTCQAFCERCVLAPMLRYSSLDRLPRP